MPPLKRRSARLATKEGTPTSPRSARSFASYAVNKLSSLLERDETPSKKQNSLDAIVSSPQTADRMPGAFDTDESLLETPRMAPIERGSRLKTPRTLPAPRVGNLDSLLRTPQTVPPPRPGTGEMHPKKFHQSTTKQPDSGLRLGFADVDKTSTNLLDTTPSKSTGVASIKAAAMTPDRAIDTTPKKSTNELKSPGFEFQWAKKDENGLGEEVQRIMDSVREEAARIKAQMQAARDEQARQDAEAGITPGRKIATPGRKGRFSDAHKAEFSKMDSITSHVSVLKGKASQNLKRTKSKADLGDESFVSERLENPSPGKRARTQASGDVSSARPAARDGTKRMSKMPSAITTPTKASLARSASARGMRTLARLPQAMASKTIRSPVAPKSEGSTKYFSALARAPSIKSILHKPQLKYSTDPVKVAAGTHVAPPKHKDAAGSDTPSSVRSPTIKRVGFALGPEVNTGHVSPSPTKSRDPVAYPDLSPRKAEGGLSSHPPGAGDFTFRSPHSRPLKFGPTSVSPSRLPKSAGSSPSRSTVRRVRPSGISTPIANTPIEFPVVPHGMPNKKRRRVEDDDEDENEENRPPGQPSSKRLKPSALVAFPKLSPEKVSQLDAAEKRKGGVISPKKSMLSLSRLNALARPKKRA